MTIPAERTRSLLYTEKFLLALLDPKETPRVPKSVREWASRCLRHYPTRMDVRWLSEECPELLGEVSKDDL